MFESVYIGMSGLQGFSKGLRVISNNVTNLNTPGFKGSKQQFGDLFYQSSDVGSSSSGRSQSQYGTGLNALGTMVNFQAGESRQTGNDLEVSLDGDGFFVVDVDGEQRYTRAGLFTFDTEGFLVVESTSHRVMGYGESGVLGPISINGLKTNAGKPTSKIEVAGNLSSTATEAELSGIKILDASGGEHAVKLTFEREDTDPTGTWTVKVVEDTNTLYETTVQFTNGYPDPDSKSFSFSYAPSNAAPQTVSVEFGVNMTSFSSGATSSLAVAKQDGFGAGNLSQLSFDGDGKLQLSYSNGEKTTGSQLAVALFDDLQTLKQQSGGFFAAGEHSVLHLGQAGSSGRGKVVAGQVELSNVDLSAEFSDLIVMQRGYQASSRIVSTANEMLQELFDMKGRR